MRDLAAVLSFQRNKWRDWPECDVSHDCACVIVMKNLCRVYQLIMYLLCRFDIIPLFQYILRYFMRINASSWEGLLIVMLDLRSYAPDENTDKNH